MKRKTACIIILSSFAIGNIIDQFIQGKKRFLSEQRINKNVSAIQILNLWILAKQKNRSICHFFRRNNFCEIAIYGMNYLGEMLKSELEGTDIIVKYGVDKNADKIHIGLKVVKPDEYLDKVDAIVVTPIYSYGEIKKQLEEKVKCPIIALDDVIGNA